MEILKKNVKSVVVAILLIVGLIAVGIYNLRCVKAIESKRSSYLRTEFDYIVEMPSLTELSEIEDISSVACVYPYHLCSNIFTSSNKAQSIKAFVSTPNYKQNERIGFIGDGTLIKGSFSGEGAVIDQKASEVLGVGVGDSISFTWGKGTNRKTITQNVKGVCIACSYDMYEDGLVLLDYTAEMQSAQKIEDESQVYTGAFVKVNDYSAKTSINQVLGGNKHIDDKAGLYEARAQHKTDVLEKRVNTTNIGLILAILILYSGISVLFIVINKKNDQTERDSGVDKSKMAKSYAIGGGICALSVFFVTFLVLLIFGISTHFIAESIKTVLSLSLPSIFVAVVVIIASKIYTDKLYAVNKKDEQFNSIRG